MPLIISSVLLVSSQAPNRSFKSKLDCSLVSIDSVNLIISRFFELLSSLVRKLKYLSMMALFKAILILFFFSKIQTFFRVTWKRAFFFLKLNVVNNKHFDIWNIRYASFAFSLLYNVVGLSIAVSGLMSPVPRSLRF